MILTDCHRLIRYVAVALAAASVLLWTKPVSAAPAPATPSTPDGLVPAPESMETVQSWATETGLPTLREAALTAPESAVGLRALGEMVDRASRDAAATAAMLTDQSAAFWLAAVDSREATQFALAARLVLLARDGRVDAVAACRPLWLVTTAEPTRGSAVLDQLFVQLEEATAPPASASLVEVADGLLARGDFAAAALAYRLVLLDLTADEYGNRDIAGHYFYCLDRLGIATVNQGPRARFNRTVVFPSIETQSRRDSQPGADSLTQAAR